MFVVIDGIDASGKKTQVDLLEKNLLQVWKTVKVVDFPRYEKDSSYFVRQYLNGEYGKNLSAKMSSLFFTMDRFDTSSELKRNLQTYDYVIANRYTSSNMIHHGCKIEDISQRKGFLNWLEDMEYNICNIPKPDKIFFLSMSFENNVKLLTKRAYEKGMTELDLHEWDNTYLQKAWQTAHDISLEYWWEKIVCDTQSGDILTREDISKKILHKIGIWKN